ncbi:MAG: class I SAM-dependent methyltransferase [Acidobacteriota bacterium]
MPETFELPPALNLSRNRTRQVSSGHDIEPERNGEAIRRVIAAIDSPLVRAYSAIRFLIIRQRFLAEIGQYLPWDGHVLDVGCGFGLFANYFAQLHPRSYFTGFDLDVGRIEMARGIASRLYLKNTEFECFSLEHFTPSRPIQAAYMLDILHHVPRKEVLVFLNSITRVLPLGGRLITKDLLTTPRYTALFALLLDRLMIGRGFVRYWTTVEMKELLRALGFEVFYHEMVDWLPYPHVIFIARKVVNIDHQVFLQEYIPAHLEKYGA